MRRILANRLIARFLDEGNPSRHTHTSPQARTAIERTQGVADIGQIAEERQPGTGMNPKMGKRPPVYPNLWERSA